MAKNINTFFKCNRLHYFFLGFLIFLEDTLKVKGVIFVIFAQNTIYAISFPNKKHYFNHPKK